MLNQPVNVIPSSLSGAGYGVIDATVPLLVSWQVSGDTPMVAYRVVIQQNDTASTQMFSTGKVTLSEPFYGVDNKGNVQMFVASAIRASQLSDAGIVNGYANGYKIVITQWWGGSTPEESITQTSPSCFITRSAPSLIIELENYTEQDPYDQKNIIIGATFSQAEGDTVKTIRWYLYEGQEQSQSNLLLDTGDIETQMLQLDYDGLFPETYYTVTAVVETSSGVTVSATKTLYVNYTVGENAGAVTVCKPTGKNYVDVTWSERSTIDGVANPDVSFDRDSVIIVDNGTVEYSPMDLQAPWSFVWKGKLNISSGITDFVSLGTSTNPYILTTDGDSVELMRGGNIIFGEQLRIHNDDELTIVVTPTHYYIRHYTYTGGTLPMLTQYPRVTLYPSDITWQTDVYSGEITYEQDSITSITLYGAQSCDYVWVEGVELSDDIINQLMYGDDYEPVASYTTLFLSSFNAGTLTAYISGSGGVPAGSSVYRKESGKQILEHIVDTSGGVLSIRDYGAKARTTYQYYVFTVGVNVYTEAFVSSEITPQYGNYTLMECIYDEDDGAYHVQAEYPFACNVNQGAMQNNNTPNILKNFTQYPNRQPVNALYASGTLSALIGSVNQTDASYTDSWQLADKINKLSVSNNPKFLRDMKGKIWKIETSEAITTEISTSNIFIPIKMTIPWVEVGSAEGASIVATPNDPVYTVS
jgi:hypothetical protein